ncbi:TIGR00266 family protein [marine bacterium AO1-C]|nr:TIGR00266 family protein [marine bacterium AO1-C]
MENQKLKYELIGDDMQMVEIELAPKETVIAGIGAMNWMEEGISFDTSLSDGSEPEKGFFERLFDAGKRVLVGESAFINHMTNMSDKNRKIGFGAPYPGKIIPIDLEAFSGKMYCLRDVFLCASLGTKISVKVNHKMGFGFFGTQGYVVQELEGDGMAFLHTGGTVVKKVLGEETLRISGGCLVAYSQGIECSVERIKGFENMFFGGQGSFITALSGTGVVYLQSLPFSKLANRVISRMPKEPRTKERRTFSDDRFSSK